MKVDFEFVTEYGVFRDALHFVDGEPLPEDDVMDLMKRQRLENWLAVIAASSQVEGE